MPTKEKKVERAPNMTIVQTRENIAKDSAESRQSLFLMKSEQLKMLKPERLENQKKRGSSLYSKQRRK